MCSFPKAVAHLQQLVPFADGSGCSGWSWEQCGAVGNLSLWTPSLYPGLWQPAGLRQKHSKWACLCPCWGYTISLRCTRLIWSWCWSSSLWRTQGTIRLLLRLISKREKVLQAEWVLWRASSEEIEMEQFCGSHPRSWILCIPLSSAVGLLWVTSTVTRGPPETSGAPTATFGECTGFLV